MDKLMNPRFPTILAQTTPIDSTNIPLSQIIQSKDLSHSGSPYKKGLYWELSPSKCFSKEKNGRLPLWELYNDNNI